MAFESMDEMSEYGIQGMGKPPWWFGRSRFLKRLWVNPIFQRAYKRNRIGTIVTPFAAFTIAFGYSLVVCGTAVFLLKVGYTSEVLMMWGMGAVFTPVGVVLGVVKIWLFIACLITTPLNLARDLGKDELNPILSTPLEDRDFYYGESLPSFVKSVRIIELLVLASLGFAIPYIVLMAIPAGYHLLEPLEFVSGLVLLVPVVVLWMGMLVLDIGLMVLLVSMVSGLYAFILPLAGAIIVSLVHYGILNGLGSILTGGVYGSFIGVPFILPMMLMGGEGIVPIYLIIMLGAALLGRGLIFGGCMLTGLIGVSTYKSKRREGNYNGGIRETGVERGGGEAY